VRFDFVSERVFGRADDRIARFEVQEPRVFTNTKNHPAGERACLPVSQATSLLGPLYSGLTDETGRTMSVSGHRRHVTHN
jgi:hypothetical protein